MKRVTLGFSVIALASALVISCNPKKNVEPVADTETQSAVYASWMNSVVSDIDMICSFLGENKFGNHFELTFYGAYPGNSGTVTAVRDTNNIMVPINGTNTPCDQLAVSWNSTRCLDGNVRDGSIFMYVPQVANRRYSRQPGWLGQINFYNFKVNGWKIQNFDTAHVPSYMYNTVPIPAGSTQTFNPMASKLTWHFGGKLLFKHPTDPSKNMIWHGDLYKTLVNTSDPLVYPPKGDAAITWSLALVNYYGQMDGTVAQVDAAGTVTPNVNYNMVIDQSVPLVRDMKCSPDQVSGVAFTNSLTVDQRGDTYHPFKAGIATFTVGNAYPRQIFYGNEGEPELPAQCDNVGEVLIKGISYRVNFDKEVK